MVSSTALRSPCSFRMLRSPTASGRLPDVRLGSSQAGRSSEAPDIDPGLPGRLGRPLDLGSAAVQGRDGDSPGFENDPGTHSSGTRFPTHEAWLAVCPPKKPRPEPGITTMPSVRRWAGDFWKRKLSSNMQARSSLATPRSWRSSPLACNPCRGALGRSPGRLGQVRTGVRSA